MLFRSLIMLIALVSVTAGFVKKDKPVRIYGLVLSLCTCGKIALYDYWGAHGKGVVIEITVLQALGLPALDPLHAALPFFSSLALLLSLIHIYCGGWDSRKRRESSFLSYSVS